jgi:hypothetical protein
MSVISRIASSDVAVRVELVMRGRSRRQGFLGWVAMVIFSQDGGAFNPFFLIS